jgi:hypothetical protein
MGKDAKCAQNFERKTRRKDIISVSESYMAYCEGADWIHLALESVLMELQLPS